MHYISTRGYGPVSFLNTLLDGLAPDGGLYLPEKYPLFTQDDLNEFSFYSYEEIAECVMAPFLGDDLETDKLKKMINRAYASFTDMEVTPLTQYDDKTWILELFHGPTLAFKDIALQLMGYLMDWALEKEKLRVNVIGATSGDTGPAAIHGLKGMENANIFMLFPHNRVSHVQRLQMTTVAEKNVFPIAIEGTFDDCQALVKEMFNDAEFRQKIKATAVNSISWARLMPQIVYYFFAWSRLQDVIGGRPLNFVVPSGNFGNAFAGYVAMQCGLPMARLVVASNVNDILYRFFTQGDYSTSGVIPTREPSIDIQVASNLERLLFDVFGRNSERLKVAMEEFKNTGKLPNLSSLELDEIHSVFSAARVEETDVLKIISKADAEQMLFLDPHTAVGVGAAEQFGDIGPKVVLSTAHPAKFPNAVKEATGQTPPSPEFIQEMFDKEESFDILPNDVEAVKEFILDNRLT